MMKLFPTKYDQVLAKVELIKMDPNTEGISIPKNAEINFVNINSSIPK